MANKVGALIKDARTDAGFTQEELAKKVKTVTASEISKAERGELELTQADLKAIAKATGVTQKSLLEAAEKSTYSAKKATAAKKTAAKKTTAKTAAKAGDLKLTATEKKLVELYRAADAETKKSAMKVLKGEDDGDLLSNLLNNAVDLLKGK